jgi:hypothetical protein
MAQLSETSTRREAEERARAMTIRCSICFERFRELEQNAGKGVPTFDESQQDDAAPNARALELHIKEGHEDGIKLLAPKLGLRYVPGYI